MYKNTSTIQIGSADSMAENCPRRLRNMLRFAYDACDDVSRQDHRQRSHSIYLPGERQNRWSESGVGIGAEDGLER